MNAQDAEAEEEAPESLLTFIAQYDPKGWVWDYGGFKVRMLQEVRVNKIVTLLLNTCGLSV